MSPLDPTVPSFPFPTSFSPTMSSDTTSTTSESIYNTKITTTSTETNPSSLDKVLKRKKAVTFHASGEEKDTPSATRRFGHGWVSTTPPKPACGDFLAVGGPIRRTKSPSLPNLPSHRTRPSAIQEKEDNSHLFDVSSRRMANLSLQPDDQYHSTHASGGYVIPQTPRHHPSFSLGHRASAPNIDTTSPSLRDNKKHWSLPQQRVAAQSIPSLPRPLLGRRSSSQLRWDDPYPEHYIEEEEDLRDEQYGEMRKVTMSSIPWTGQKRNVYLPSIPSHMTDDLLEEIASEYGSVLSVRLGQRDCKSGYSGPGGYAARLFDTPDQAANFLGALRSLGMACEYGREDFQTEWKAREDRNSSNLYLQGLSLMDGAEELAALLSPYGTVVSMKPLIDDEGRRRGPVLARLQSRPQAEAAIRGLNGRLYPKTGESLQIRIADSDAQKSLKKKASTLASGSIDPDELEPVGLFTTPVDRYDDQRLQRALLQKRQDLLGALRGLDEQLYASPLTAQQTTPGPSAVTAHRPHQLSLDDYSEMYTLPTNGGFALSPNTRAESIVYPSQHYSTWPRSATHPASLGLNHTRSSPELGNGVHPARLLWPEQSR